MSDTTKAPAKTGKANGFTIAGYVGGLRIRRRAQSTQRTLALEEAKSL